MMGTVKLGETLRILVDTAGATGAAVNADSLPTAAVYDQGTIMGYAPTVTNKATGLYEVAIVCSAGNGFAVGHEYSAAAIAIVGGITGRAGIAAFRVAARGIDDLSFPSVSGRQIVIDASGQVTVGSVANDAITAAALAADAGTEIRSGLATAVDLAAAVAPLATAAQVTTVAGYTDTLEAALAVVHNFVDTLEARLPAALVNGRIPAYVGEVDPAIQAALVDDVWNEPIVGHTTVGTVGNKLNAAASGGGGGGGSGDPDAVWDVILPSHLVEDTTGRALSDVHVTTSDIRTAVTAGVRTSQHDLGTLDANEASRAISMLHATDAVVMLSGTFDGATVVVEIADSATAEVVIWEAYEDVAGDNPRTTPGLVKLVGPINIVRARMSGAGASSSVRVSINIRSDH